MPNHQPRDRASDSRPPDVSDEAYDDSVALTPMIRTLWTYRRAIVRSVAGLVAVLCIVVLVTLLRSPAERLASLQFRLVFDGVDRASTRTA